MKTFHQFLSESPKTFTLADFSKIIESSKLTTEFSHDATGASVMREKRLPRLIELLNQYQTGDVPNPVFNDIKDVANRFAEVATNHPDYVWAAIRANRDINTWDFGVSTTHVVPGKLKKAQAELTKQKGNSDAVIYFAWLVDVLTELLPVAVAVENMKTRIVKRQPKAAEDMHAKYVAPMSSQESGKLVIDALKKMSQAIYDDFAKAVTSYLTHEAESMNTLSRKEQQDSRNDVLSLHAIWDEKSYYTRRNDTEGKRLVADYKKTLTAEGKKAADDMQQAFVYKNAKKLASLLDAKKSPLKGEPVILSAKAGARGTFEGDMRINFVDGSSFEVRNQVVFKTNQYGTFFMQYPTTFHNVVLPNGEKMGQPSEERMNTVFTKA